MKSLKSALNCQRNVLNCIPVELSVVGVSGVERYGSATGEYCRHGVNRTTIKLIS